VVLLVGANGVDMQTAIVDESFSQNELTPVADVQLDTEFKKFGLSSLIYDGTGDLISMPSTADFTLADEDFTIEMWSRIAAEPGDHVDFLAKWDGPTNNASWVLEYQVTENQLRFYMSTDGTATVWASFDLDSDGIGVAGFFDSNWHHLAVVRSGGTVTVYIDGIAGADTWVGGAASLYANVTDVTIGARIESAATFRVVTGNLDEIRVTKGVARYTEAFTPPTEEFIRGAGPVDPYWDQVVLLVGPIGVDASTEILDESLSNILLTTNGDAQLDTAYRKFGNASLMLDGTVDCVETPANPDHDFGTNDFTIEFWTRMTAEPTDNHVWISKYDSTTNERQWSVYFDFTNNRVAMHTSTTGTDYFYTSFDLDTDGIGLAGFFDGNWHHVAVVRDGTTTKMFVDGLLGSEEWTVGASALNANTNIRTIIGARSNGAGEYVHIDAHMDEIRITNGTARYTEAFTPPTERFIRGPHPIIDYVTVLEYEIYTLIGAPQQAVSAKTLEAFTLIGAPQTQVSAKSLEMYTIVEV